MKKKNSEIIENYDLSEFFPLFWKQCDKCKNDVKMEKMWDIKLICGKWQNEYSEGSFRHKYFCKDCFKSKNELREYCNERT